MKDNLHERLGKKIHTGTACSEATAEELAKESIRMVLKSKNVLSIFIKEVDEILYLAEGGVGWHDQALLQRMRELRNGYIPILKKELDIP